MTEHSTPVMGQGLVYDDGRPGHRGVKGVVVGLFPGGFVAQFQDRAETNTIRDSDREWMDHITFEAVTPKDSAF
jgi:hypothetical protein